MTGVADKMLKDKISTSITKLDASRGQACTPPAHDAVVDGVKCLLEIKAFELENGADSDSSEVTLLGGRLATFKNIRITGRDVVLICLILAMIAVALKDYIIS